MAVSRKQLKQIIVETINEIGELNNVTPKKFIKSDEFNYQFYIDSNVIDVEFEALDLTEDEFFMYSKLFNISLLQPTDTIFNIVYKFNGSTIKDNEVNLSLHEYNTIMITILEIIKSFILSMQPKALSFGSLNPNQHSYFMVLAKKQLSALTNWNYKISKQLGVLLINEK